MNGSDAFLPLRDPGSPDRVFVFPGQGSQILGMGKDIYDSHAVARELYDRADEILGFPLSRMCFEGSESDLQRTENAQPAIAVTSLALLKVAAERSPDILSRPAYVAGHSLGEYSALVAAGALEFDDAMRLLRLRGRLMQAAGEANPGAMAAVMGLDAAKVQEACEATGAEVSTDNAPGQTVIGGPADVVARAVEEATARGAVRVVTLNVSGAFHTSLMAPAASGLAESIATVPISSPSVPVIANCSAQPIGDADQIRHELVEQVRTAVRWRQTVEFLLNSGVTTFMEFGPGKVLTSITKRMRPSSRCFTVNEAAATEIKL